MTDTYRCPRCGRYEGRMTRSGKCRCDWCAQSFKKAKNLLAPKDKENK